MYKILTLEFKNKIVFESVQIDDEFVPMGEYREFEKEDLDFMRSFKERYFLNIKKGKGSITEIVYEFSSKTDDFEEIFSVLLPYQSKIDLNMYIETEYEPLDYDNADAYFVAFSDGCDYYDDEKYNSLEILCTEEDCCVRGHKETMYIEPTRKQVKEFSKKFIGATTEDGVNVISLPLKAFLEEKGVSANLFKPVYQKKGTIWAYYLFGEEHLLPSLSVLDDANDWIEICPECNRKNIRISERDKGESLWAEFTDASAYGLYPQTERWEIRRTVLENLNDINLTEDYYLSDRYLVVSKKVFDLLREKVPMIIETSEPIFVSDFDVKIENGMLIKEYM